MKKHKLLYLSVLQLAIFVLVFTLFFFSLGVNLLVSVLASFVIYAATFLLFHVLTLPFFILPKIRGAVYLPSSDEKIETMIKLLGLKKGQKMADLGSGDGRVTIAFAQKGIEAHGYELNPILVKRSQQNIKQAGVERIAFAHWQSLWDVDVSQFDGIALYGFPHIMKDLEKKLQNEMKRGAKLASNSFEFPGWKPTKEVKGVRLYVKK